ncbi:MAG: hypothetical protein ACE5EU_08700 [Paracoccaceae bacterium]
MKMTTTVAAALIGLAAAFGPAGAAPGAGPAERPRVIATGGYHFGGHRGGYRLGHYRGGRHFGGHRRYRHGHRYGHHRGHHRGHRHGHHRGHHRGYGHGHGGYDPYYYGGAALGTYLFLRSLEGY